MSRSIENILEPNDSPSKALENRNKPINSGSTLEGSNWRLSTVSTDPIDVNTSLLTFTQQKEGTFSIIGEGADGDGITLIHNTVIMGNLDVQGMQTSISTMDMVVEDNHIYLNKGYKTVVAQTGGLVVNYLPTATSTTSDTGGFSTVKIVNVVSEAGFAAIDRQLGQIDSCNLVTPIPQSSFCPIQQPIGISIRSWSTQ